MQCATAVARLGLNTHMSTKITASSINLLRSSIYSVLGTTSTGYGSELASRDAVAGQLITTSSYYALVDDLRRCWIHQTGSLEGFLTGSDAAPTTSDPIKSGVIDPLISAIVANKYNTTSTQQLQDSLASSTATIYAGTNLTYQIDYSFLDKTNTNYFFNLGGSIAASLVHANGVYTGDASKWANFVDWANAQISSIGYNRVQWNQGGTPTSINTSYSSSTNFAIKLGIFARNDHTIRSTLTVTNFLSTVSVITTATSLVNYSGLGPSIQGYYGVSSPRPQATVNSNFGLSQTPVPTQILSVDQPDDFTMTSNGNSSAQTITIRNIGNSTCTVNTVIASYLNVYYLLPEIDGSLSSIYPTWTINPGDTHTFSLRYLSNTGLTAGTYYGYLSVYSDATISVIQKTIKVVVTDPDYDFTISPNPLVVDWAGSSPLGMYFDAVEVNGTGSYAGSSVGTDPAIWDSVGTGPNQLRVRFKPAGVSYVTGSYSATLNFSMQGPSGIVPKTAAITINYTAPVVPITQNLGRWISAYQKDNGVIGASYDIINDVRYITLGFGMNADGGGTVADTSGSNVNIANLSTATNADANFAVGPVLYSGPTNSTYSNFLKPYNAGTNTDGHGVWINDSGWSPVDVYVARTFTFTVTTGGTHTYRFAADNLAYFTIEGTVIGDLRYPTNGDRTTPDPVQDTFQLTTGVKTLTIYFYNENNGYPDNVNNPGSLALTITGPTGLTVWDSNQPVRTGYVPYQYWNEVYRIPLYTSTSSPATYYSKDYIIKNLCPLNKYSYGYYFGDTGSAEQGSMFTVTQSTLNDITITLNVKSARDIADKTTNYASYLFYYYSDVLGADRLTNLELNPGVGNPTRYYTGFDRNGAVTTALLPQPAAPYVPPAPEPVYVGSGGGCPDPNTLILVSEGGYTCPAGELIVGDMVWTRHEITGVYDSYPVTFVGIIEQPRVRIQFDDGIDMIVSDTHKFLMSDLSWKQVFQLASGDIVTGVECNKTVANIESIGIGPVVKITVEQAHTYVAAGLISHNKQDTSIGSVIEI